VRENLEDFVQPQFNAKPGDEQLGAARDQIETWLKRQENETRAARSTDDSVSSDEESRGSERQRGEKEGSESDSESPKRDRIEIIDSPALAPAPPLKRLKTDELELDANDRAAPSNS
jgi:hypothetical protein